MSQKKKANITAIRDEPYQFENLEALDLSISLVTGIPWAVMSYKRDQK